jgi:hypothetical protein
MDRLARDVLREGKACHGLMGKGLIRLIYHKSTPHTTSISTGNVIKTPSMVNKSILSPMHARQNFLV